MTDNNRFIEAAQKQGFTDPLDESPFENPDGWHYGSVQQTGGYILCRIWHSWDGHTGEHSGRDTEYQVVYGQEKHVSVHKYEWDSDLGGYEYTDEIETRTVDENTDERKAQLAKELMHEYQHLAQ